MRPHDYVSNVYENLLPVLLLKQYYDHIGTVALLTAKPLQFLLYCVQIN